MLYALTVANGQVVASLDVGQANHFATPTLAIGQSAAAGALQLATILIIGFGLHNMIEGFGIAGPLTGQSVTWKFIVLAGLICGWGAVLRSRLLGFFSSSDVVFFFL